MLGFVPHHQPTFLSFFCIIERTLMKVSLEKEVSGYNRWLFSRLDA